MKKRIWELDALRGLCVLGMVAVHLVYDLVSLYRLVQWELPAEFLFVQQWGGILFLLISGISITLGRHHIKRGLVVFACGLICTAVTYGMYRFGMAGKSIIIYFGVLHCLGVCMLLWQAVKKFPVWLLAAVGITLVFIGLWLIDGPRVDYPWLIPLGVRFPRFASSDYFPLLPYFGFFLLGAVMGKTLYRKKESLLPHVRENTPVLAFLRFCGKQSLWIYLLHQPIISGICFLLLQFQ